MSPRGSVHLAGGRIALADLGEWSELALDAEVTDDAVVLSRLEVRHGKGRASAFGALRGLAGPEAKLEGKLSASSLPLTSAGMELATVTLDATASGAYRDRTLEVELRVPHGLVRLRRGRRGTSSRSSRARTWWSGGPRSRRSSGARPGPGPGPRAAARSGRSRSTCTRSSRATSS